MRKDETCIPSEVQPWHRVGGLEHICELRKSSQVLYAILVTMVRTIYSGRGGRTFGCPDVEWSSDPKRTGIWIDTELRWEDMRPDFTPSIYVCLGEIGYQSIPTLDMHGRTFTSNGGERHYERTASGSASIVHCCDTAGSACSLADNTENYLSLLQEQICDEYCFDHFRVAGRVPRQKKETSQTAGKGKYVSVVNVQFDFTDAWAVKVESPILKAVSMVDAGSSKVRVTGTDVDVSNGVAVITFGDASTETK